jgi:hypothetical protein
MSAMDAPKEKWFFSAGKPVKGGAAIGGGKVYVGDEGRRYYHRFMTLDRAYRPSRVSCFVRFTKERVEYWSGMCPSLEGDSYWITYGLKDAEAYIAEMLTTSIEPLLMYNLNGSTKPTVERLAVI